VSFVANLWRYRAAAIEGSVSTQRRARKSNAGRRPQLTDQQSFELYCAVTGRARGECISDACEKFARANGLSIPWESLRNRFEAMQAEAPDLAAGGLLLTSSEWIARSRGSRKKIKFL
jgi:hypothetical protein